jgi:hypothetical protein
MARRLRTMGNLRQCSSATAGDSQSRQREKQSAVHCRPLKFVPGTLDCESSLHRDRASQGLSQSARLRQVGAAPRPHHGFQLGADLADPCASPAPPPGTACPACLRSLPPLQGRTYCCSHLLRDESLLLGLAPDPTNGWWRTGPQASYATCRLFLASPTKRPATRLHGKGLPRVDHPGEPPQDRQGGTAPS